MKKAELVKHIFGPEPSYIDRDSQKILDKVLDLCNMYETEIRRLRKPGAKGDNVPTLFITEQMNFRFSLTEKGQQRLLNDSFCAMLKERGVKFTATSTSVTIMDVVMQDVQFYCDLINF